MIIREYELELKIRRGKIPYLKKKNCYDYNTTDDALTSTKKFRL